MEEPPRTNDEDGSEPVQRIAGRCRHGPPGRTTKSQIMIAKMMTEKASVPNINVYGREVINNNELIQDSIALTFEEVHDLVGALYALKLPTAFG